MDTWNLSCNQDGRGRKTLGLCGQLLWQNQWTPHSVRELAQIIMWRAIEEGTHTYMCMCIHTTCTHVHTLHTAKKQECKFFQYHWSEIKWSWNLSQCDATTRQTASREMRQPPAGSNISLCLVYKVPTLATVHLKHLRNQIKLDTMSWPSSIWVSFIHKLITTGIFILIKTF